MRNPPCASCQDEGTAPLAKPLGRYVKGQWLCEDCAKELAYGRLPNVTNGYIPDYHTPRQMHGKGKTN